MWGPLAGAAILQIDSWDEDVSDWAHDSTPVFGSESNAADWSTGLQVASVTVYAASVLAAQAARSTATGSSRRRREPRSGSALRGDQRRNQRSQVGRLARAAGRIGRRQLSSGHASTAAVFDTLAVRNLETIDMSPALRTTLVVGTGAITAGTAWARVEANKHYPSDVLVGVAIGNYMAAFFTEASWASHPMRGSPSARKRRPAERCCASMCGSSGTVTAAAAVHRRPAQP